MGKRSELEIERESIEWVFRLTGGELNQLDAWRSYQDASGKTPDGAFRHFYDGVPEYAGQDFGDKFDGWVDYFTAVTCCLYGSPPESIHIEGKLYQLVSSYQSSGETECPCGEVEESEEAATTTCELCSREPGEKHGHIYIGDGWCELVYRHDGIEHMRQLARQHNAVVWEEEIAEMTCQADDCGEVTERPLGHEACGECDHNAVKVRPTGRKAWWWWTCSPGCLPDSDLMGPFKKEVDALEDSTSGLE